MHREPYRRFVGRGPFDPVLRMGRDVDVVPGAHVHHPVLEGEACRPGQDHDPLVLWLVVPEVRRRAVPCADDPFKPDAIALLKNRGEFFGKIGGDVG